MYVYRHTCMDIYVYLYVYECIYACTYTYVLALFAQKDKKPRYFDNSEHIKSAGLTSNNILHWKLLREMAHYRVGAG